MPDWIIEMTITTGQHEADSRSVTVENVARQEVAKIMGIEQCLLWGRDDGLVPAAALDYWRSAKSNGNVQVYEVLSALEANWALTFHVRPKGDDEQPAPQAQPRAPAQNGKPAVAQPVSSPQYNLNDLVSMFRARYDFLMAEQKRISTELAAMSQFVQKPKRRYVRKVKADG